MERFLPVSLLFLLGACFPSASASYAAAAGGPSHPTTTAAQWTEVDGRATSLAREGSTSVGPAEHLLGQGFTVEKRFSVTGGHCYTAGIAWAFDAQAQATVIYQARSDGQSVNDSVNGANSRLSGRAGALHFCADRDGEALLNLSAIGPNGAIANNELLEFAFVLGDRAESASDATTRRARDAAAGAEARTRMDTNIAVAGERERRELERRCKKCREDFRLCQVQSAYERQHPKRGVSVATDCESNFRNCATGHYSGTQAEMEQCGPPPQ
jgi:hypothetical protein